MEASLEFPIHFLKIYSNDLVSGFSHAWDPFPQFIATLTAQDWHKPCYHAFGIIPVHSLAHAGFFELAIHGWDIRSALEPSAPLSPDTLAAMLDFFSECPHWFFFPDARLSTPIRYRFAFTGALSGPWDIVVEGDTAYIQVGGKDIVYDLSGKTQSVPVKMEGGRIEFKPPFDPPALVFEGNKMTATLEGGFVDAWEKVP